MPELLTRLRELILGGATVLTIGSGWILVGPEGSEAPTVRIAAFNIQVFGKTKAGKEDVMDVLARTARQFDVVVVQEIRDASQEVADDFLTLINEEPEAEYEMHEGPRLGRTSSQEQYAVYYRPAAVEFIDASVPDDPSDIFEREPIIVSLRAGSFDFKLVAIHIKPDSALVELQALEDVVLDLAASEPDEQDIVILGDLNADCDYLDEDAPDLPFSGEDFVWVIGNEVVTTTITECTYDRIILTDETVASTYVQGSAAAFRFDEEFGLTDPDFVRSISDHYPVYAEFLAAGLDNDP